MFTPPRALWALAVLTAALAPSAFGRTLTVSAASSLAEAVGAVAEAFEARNPDVDVVLNLGGSSTLATQIVQGAPVDVFAAADAAQMDVVVAAGLAAAEPVPFATNRLVVVTVAESDVRTLDDLARDGVLLVLAGPEVPAGAYAREALARLEARMGEGYAARVLANLASEETNVRQVAAKVRLGEADAGIVYATDVAAVPDGRIVDIPGDANVVARYFVAVLRDAREPADAHAFVAFLTSSDGRRILAEHGFGPSGEGP